MTPRISDEYELAKTTTIEEGAELTQVLCKIDRFGFFNHNPYTGDENVTLLAEEAGDLYGALDWLLDLSSQKLTPEERVLFWQTVLDRRSTKRDKVIALNNGELNAPLPTRAAA